MKFRCPYCRRMMGETSRARCPHCGQIMVVPRRLGRFAGAPRTKAAPARASRRGRDEAGPPWAGAWSGGRRPLTLVFCLAIVGGAGAILLTRVNVAFPASARRDPRVVAEGELEALRMGLELFRRDGARYPETGEGLKALVLDPGIDEWGGPYVTRIKVDPWRRPYRYARTNGTVRLLSRGPDGVEDTADDVVPSDPSPEEVEAVASARKTGRAGHAAGETD